MKLAVAGKGGVGKTLVAGTVARLLARDGYRVLAVDADPAMNLSYALGIPQEAVSNVVPIAENEELIRERAGWRFGEVFTLTPRVEDIADRFGITGPDGVRLLIMGTVRYGGSGCMCPANALIRALISHITLARDEAIVMDMEAGLEHLGRGTARGFDALLCVVEPGRQAIETAGKIAALSADIGIRRVYAVGNKVMDEEGTKLIEEGVDALGLELIGVIPFDVEVLKADASRIAPLDYNPNSPAIKAITKIKETLIRKLSGGD